MKAKKCTGLLVLVFFLICCSESGEEKFRTFDLPLIQQSLVLQYSGKVQEDTGLQRKYLKQAQRENYKGGIATCYINLGRMNLYTDINEYLFFLKKAESELQNTESSVQKGRLFTEYTICYNYLNMPAYAVYYNNEGIAALKKVNDTLIRKYLLADAFRARAEVFKKLSKLDSAFAYFHKSRTLKRKDVIIDAMLADYHLNNNKLDSARFYLNSALALSKRNYLPYEAAHIYEVSGNYEMKFRDYHKAEEAYLNAFKASEKTKVILRGVHSNLYASLADVYLKNGNFTKAKYFKDKQRHENKLINENILAGYPQARNKFIEDVKRGAEGEKPKIYILFIFLAIFIIAGRYLFLIVKRIDDQKYQFQHETNDLQEEFYNKKYNEIISLARKNDSSFLKKFKEVYPEFVVNLQNINPDLKNSELIFCAYMKINFTTKEIATYTFVQPESVQQRKRRLRKRLNLSSDIDLYKFFSEL